MRSVWRLSYYDDEVALFATLESAKQQAYAKAPMFHNGAGPVTWRKDGLDTWHSVNVKGWTIDECEVHP